MKLNSVLRTVSPMFLSVGALAFTVAIASAADSYLTPSGSGSKSGVDWSNAYSQSDLTTAVSNLAAGDTLNIGSGTYYTGSGPIITINSSGSSGSPKTITGVDTGGGLPVFNGSYNVNNSASSSDIFLKFSGSTAYWVFKDLVLEQYAFPVRMDASGTTYDLRHDITFDNIDGQNVTDFFQLRNASDITIQNCDVIRYKKKGFRYADYTAYLSFENCTADANGGDDDFPTQSIPAGFVGGDTDYEAIIHDISFTDCIARNNRFVQSSGTYWNGDGFSSEEATYNISYTRCFSFDNHDGGFDDKADNITYVSCIAMGNGKGFRYWGNNGVYINCLSAYNKAWGTSTSASDGLWVGRQSEGNVGVAHVYLSTFHNNDEWALESYDGGKITATDCILSVDGVFTDGELEETTSDITLVDTVKYKVSDSYTTDPDFVDPSASWTGSPADAFDSDTYAPDKGYYSVYTAGSGPTATISATDAAAGEPSNDGEFTVTLSPAPASPITVGLSVSGTAINGTDYATIGSSVSVGTGGTATVAVDVTDDSEVESSETVILSLAAGVGYNVGLPSSSTVTITDEDVATPTISVTAIDEDAGEPYYDGKYRLTASPAPTSEININVSMAGSAINGTDYKTIANYGYVTMGSSGTVDVLLDVTNDSIVEGDETAVLTVTSGSGYLVGTPASASITIEDNDIAPVITCSVADSTAGEPNNDAKFRITATPSPSANITVNIQMTGTATGGGADYATISSTVTLNSANKDILLDVKNDSLVEGNETAIMNVVAGTGYTVGTPSSATITIVDDDD